MFGYFKELLKFYIKFRKWSYSRKVAVPIGSGPRSGVLALTIRSRVRAKVHKLPKILREAGFVAKRNFGSLLLIGKYTIT